MITAEEARTRVDEYENGILHVKDALKVIEENIRCNSKYGEHSTVYRYYPEGVNRMDMIVEELQSNGYCVKCFEDKDNEGYGYYRIVIQW